MQALPSSSLGVTLPVEKKQLHHNKFHLSRTSPQMHIGKRSPSVSRSNSSSPGSKRASPSSQRKTEYIYVKCNNGESKRRLESTAEYLQLPTDSLKRLIEAPMGRRFIERRWVNKIKGQNPIKISEEQKDKIRSVIPESIYPQLFNQTCLVYELVVLNKFFDCCSNDEIHFRRSKTGLPLPIHSPKCRDHFAIFNEILLGVGKSKKTYKALNLETLKGKAYGKTVRTDNFDLYTEISENEAKIQWHMQNKLVVGLDYLSSWRSKNKTELKFGMVMELCNCEDLGKLISSKAINALTVDALLNLFEECLYCVLLLKLKKIRHRDVKPDNFLITSENNQYHIKLGDFGLSSFFDLERSDPKCLLGSPIFMAPEFIKGHHKKKLGFEKRKEGEELLKKIKEQENNLVKHKFTIELMRNSSQQNTQNSLLQDIKNTLDEFNEACRLLSELRVNSTNLIEEGNNLVNEGDALLNNYSCDLWPLGIIFHYMLTGNQYAPIIGCKDPNDFYSKMLKASQEDINLRYSGIIHPLGPYLQEFILKILTLDHAKRPTIEQCIEEFKGIKKTILENFKPNPSSGSTNYASISAISWPKPTAGLPKNLPPKPLPIPPNAPTRLSKQKSSNDLTPGQSKKVKQSNL